MGGPFGGYNQSPGYSPFAGKTGMSPGYGRMPPGYGSTYGGMPPWYGGGRMPGQFPGLPQQSMLPSGASQTQGPDLGQQMRVNYNVNMPSPAMNQNASPAASSQPSPMVPPVDPFSASLLGKFLSMISSGYARSPYGGGLSPGQFLPGQYPNQAMPVGPTPQTRLQGGQIVGQSSQIPGKAPEYLGPVGPFEWGVRASMLNNMLNSMPALFGGQLVSSPFMGGQFYNTPRSRGLSYYSGKRAGPLQGGVGVYPERWDPYQGLYWWNPS